MITEATLLPCPFCGTLGSQPPYRRGRTVNVRGSRHFAKCEICGAEGSHEMTEAEAIAAWNSRAVAASQPASVTLAEDAITKGETASQMLDRLGMDGAKWAAEFRTTALRLGYSDMDEGWLIGWFCNAIMAGHDRAQSPDATLEPAAVTLADAMKVIAARLEEKHRQHITSLGRDPDEYSSQFSLALDKLKTALRAIEGGEA